MRIREYYFNNMGGTSNIFKRKWKVKLIIGVISLAISLIIFFLYMYVWNSPLLITACNATILMTAVFLALAGLMALEMFGAFDTMAYGFRTLGHYMFTYKRAPKYHDLVDFRDQKNVKRAVSNHYYIPFLVIGCMYLIACIVLEIVFHVKTGV